MKKILFFSSTDKTKFNSLSKLLITLMSVIILIQFGFHLLMFVSVCVTELGRERNFKSHTSDILLHYTFNEKL